VDRGYCDGLVFTGACGADHRLLQFRREFCGYDKDGGAWQNRL